MAPSSVTRLQCLVVGAGVVGLAVGRALQRAGLQTVVADKNATFGMETSSRNSEVIHAGIYYPQGSRKAEFCVRGKQLLYDYCSAHGVEHERIGKLIVATCETELPILESYAASALANGVDDLRFVDAGILRQEEPHLRAVGALHSPSTGIIDSHGYMRSLLHDLEDAGGHFVARTHFIGGAIERSGILLRDASGETFETQYLVNSCGLAAPSFAASLSGFPSAFVPQERYAIGHYYALLGRSPFNQLIYPVAVNGGLGTHLTLDLARSARFGPDVSWIDTVDYSFDESRKGRFVESIRRYYPGLDESLLVPGYTGIRPKLAGPGEPNADFQIQTENHHGIAGLVNLFGIESPGLTASLAIAEKVATLLLGNHAR
jgi:L-2-hydroxyglutarate oxidase LhgO